MKLFVVIFGVLATANCFPFEDLIVKEWFQYKLKHFKNYLDELEDQTHLQMYLLNKRLIDEHNKLYKLGKVSYELALNHFADHIDDDKPKKGCSLNISEAFQSDTLQGASNPEMYKSQNGDLPSRIDWRQKNAVTDVQNQKECGSCWSFAATGTLEGQLARKTGKLTPLSEQNLIDCSRGGNNGCGGGNANRALQWVQDNGIDTDQSYPYENRQANCRFNKGKSVGKVVGTVNLPKGDENALINAVAHVGPIAVALDASQKSFKFYKGGVYDDSSCNPNNLGHAMLVAGYYEDSYLVKNSWGPQWGESGYIRIARNKNNRCGIASQGTYPKVG